MAVKKANKKKKTKARMPALKTAAKRKSPKKKLVAQRKKKVAPIPKGYHSITPYLIVDDAASAILFYKKVFNAKEVMRMDHPSGKVGHCELKIGDSKIMLADEYPEMDARSPKNYNGSPVGIHLYVKDVDATMSLALAEGAKLIRGAEDMFYGDRSGTLEDPFGHKWHVSTHIEDVSPAQTRKRAEALFAKKSQE